MKKPIVLVHGLFGHLHDPRILSAIGNEGVYAPDLLGYGKHAQASLDNLVLQKQADHVAKFIQDNGLAVVNIVGHSVGGAVAVLLACKHPHLVASLTSVEGNFTLKDAFWSRQIAEKDLSEVEEIIAGYKADPDAWISSAGVPLNEWTKALARSWLDNQPASTIKTQARAVVEATGKPEYLENIRMLLASDLPFHLLAGERSRKGWDVPGWVIEQATGNRDIPDTGHLMMAENPAAFGAAVRKCQQ